MKTFAVIGVLSAAVLFTGCSSIVSKSEYAVAVNSVPAGAAFEVTNKAGQKVHSGVTPSSVTLKASSGFFQGESYTFSVMKDGYAPKNYTLTSGIDGWYFGNILLGGLIGMLIVDPATGAMYKLSDRVDISLDQKVSKVSSSDLVIASIDSLTSDQLEKLELLN